MGRPPYSEIRQQIVEILNYLKRDYGYNLFKVYCRIFPKVSMRVVYYHLAKGVELGIFIMERVKVEGDYSWGNTAEKVYYSLGSSSLAVGDPDVEKFFSNNEVSQPGENHEQQDEQNTELVD